MNDRIIGYTIIITVFFLLVIPAGYLIWQRSTPKVERIIEFNHVVGLSFLSVQDPVRILGVEVGVVKRIEYAESCALVTIETNRDVTLYPGYRIEVLAKGVMGERFLTINAGLPRGKALPPETRLIGVTSVGPDEALSYIGLLAQTVHKLKILSKGLRFGTAKNGSLISEVWEIATQIDTLTQTLTATASSFSSTLSQQLTAADSLITASRLFAVAFTDSMTTSVTQLHTLLNGIEHILYKVKPLLQQTGTLIEKMDSPQLPLWKEYNHSLSERLNLLGELLHTLSGDSLVLPVRLW